MTLEIRLAENKDYDSIYSLFADNEFIEPNLDNLQFRERCNWQYVNNPPNIHYQWIAEGGGDIVAHYAMIPLPFIKNGREAIAGIGSNLVIDENSRDGMLFLRLQKHFLKKYINFDIDFTYSLVTRPGVLVVHLRTGFKKIGQLPVLIRPLKITKIFNHFVKISSLRALMHYPLKIAEALLKFSYIRPSSNTLIEKVEHFTPSIDNFLERFLSQYDYIAKRNSQILNWRFTSYPFRNYEIFQARRSGDIVGYMVTRKMPMKDFESLAIVDLACLKGDVDAQRALLTKAHQLAVHYDVDVCASLQNPHLDLVKTMHRCGYLNSPESFTLCTHEVAGSDDLMNESTFPHWFVSWFDNDYV